jgi:hypothetical protein
MPLRFTGNSTMHRLRGGVMTLQEAMAQATSEILREKGLVSVRQINDHDCFNWAVKVFNLFPGTAIGGHRIDNEGQSYIIYEGVCYDAETPDGTGDWWNLTSFRRMIQDSVGANGDKPFSFVRL